MLCLIEWIYLFYFSKNLAVKTLFKSKKTKRDDYKKTGR